MDREPPMQSVDVLGVPVSSVNMDQALDRIEHWIRDRDRQYVCVTDVHALMRARADRELLEVYRRAGLVTPDGMPLVWWNRLEGQRHVTRVYGPDLLQASCARSLEGGFRHYFYGGDEGVARALADSLSRRYPGLQVVGTHAPPFRELTAAERAEDVRRINAAAPDIVWVGLGAPKQERWMAQNRAALEAPVLIGVGAAFDFLSGRKPQAPRWLQGTGLEWAFRLATEPRRLAGRYAFSHPRFVLLALSHWARRARSNIG